MEAYAILALVGLGTLFSNSRRDVLSSKKNRGKRRQMTIDEAQQDEFDRAQMMARAARYPSDTGVIDSNSRRLNHSEFDVENPVYSELAGREFSAEDFKHINQQPFYGSKVTQYTSDRMSEFKLGEERGARKQEVEPFFSPAMGATYQAGTPVVSPVYQDRMESLTSQNNVLPFDQVRVGPGVGQGYTAAPTGGFTQPQDRDYILPKTVDELRPLVNRKTHLEGRVIPGSAPERRGLEPNFSKNKQDTLFDITDRGLVATSGPSQARSLRPDVSHSGSRAPRVVRGHVGPAGAGVNEPTPARPDFDVRGRVLPEKNDRFGVATRTDRGIDPSALFSKDVALSNERMSGAMPENYFGNAVQYSGPRSDADVRSLKVSGKEELQDSKRLYNAMSVQVPGQGPAFDVTKPSRTTRRETLIEKFPVANLSGRDEVYANMSSDDGGKTTIREHGPVGFHKLNMKNAQTKGQVFNYDAPKGTTRQLTHKSRLQTPGSMTNPGAYTTTSVEDRMTNRELSHLSYSGIARNENPVGGYGNSQLSQQGSLTLNSRDTTSSDYMGHAGGDIKKPMSYEALYNETVRTVKDKINESRLFNGVGADKGKSIELTGDHREPSVSLQTSRIEGGDYHQTYNSAGLGEETRETGRLPQDDRLDDDLLDYLRSNPFVVGLKKEVGMSGPEDPNKNPDPSRNQGLS